VRQALWATGLLLLLAACSLPRGAALQSEVLRASDAEDTPFAVYPVNRATLADLQSWPRVSSFNSWIGKTRGPSSPIIAAGDRIDLIIWDNSDDSLFSAPGQKVVDMQNIQVGPAGSVFIPYLDEVYISGQTPDGARVLIQDRMMRILPTAQVQLHYLAGIRSSVSLVGGVGKPGTYPLPDRNFSVLNLISTGGGALQGLRNPQVKLMRDGKTYQVPLSRLFDDAALDTVLRGGDKVIVERDDRYFQALGASGKETLVYFEHDTVNALESMSLVGGLLDSRADPKGILILREYPASAVRSDGRGPSRTDMVFVIDLTSADGLFSARRFQIEPGDVVLVTESPVTKIKTVLGLIGGVFGIANQAQDTTN